MPPAITISPLAARRFLIRALGLEPPFAGVATALQHLGYVQIDPINVCGRMHDLILRNRVAGYREGDLMRHLHGDGPPLPPASRTAFEHHLPDKGLLVAFLFEAWPHLLSAMQQRSRSPSAWSGRLTPREKTLATHLLEEIAARGPLGSEDFEDDRQARRVWGAAKLVKATLQKLFFHGRLLITQRVHNRRRYDLPERVLPAHVLKQSAPPAEETRRWLIELKLRQRRLTTLKRDEIPLVEDLVQPVSVTGCPPLFCLREDAELLGSSADRLPSSAENRSNGAPSIRLLAPLDPLIYDRRATAALWDFDYTWEAYTPPHKRVRGYYALPVLAGTEIVGHVDPKADRDAGKLVIESRRIRRGHAIADAMRELSRWLALE